MKNHKELCLLAADLLARFTNKETDKIAINYTDQLVALSYGALQMLIVGKISLVKPMIDSAFMLGYEAGKNSKARDFKPDMWAVADD